jgi:lipoate---protein ligase
VGAVPRPRFLTEAASRAVGDQELFDVEAMRAHRRRWLSVRDVERPVLVLGSTQRPEDVDANAAERAGTAVLRRRSGGGAVLVEPGRAVWLDTWVPRADSLFEDDVRRSRAWVGSWWADALGGAVAVHEGPPVCTPWSDVVCFAGTAAGEVMAGGRKVVGVSQWRCKEGALTHSLAYVGVDWTLMARLLRLPDEAAGELAATTATLGQLDPPRGRTGLVTSLLEHLPGGAGWHIDRP